MRRLSCCPEGLSGSQRTAARGMRELVAVPRWSQGIRQAVRPASLAHRPIPDHGDDASVMEWLAKAKSAGKMGDLPPG